MDKHIIELKGLTKRYGDFVAVDNLDLAISKGEVFGLLGPNGAGKSTTILMMLGLTEPTNGKAFVCGIDATTNPIDVKRRVGYLPDDVGFYDQLTGRDNLIYTAKLNSLSTHEATKRVDTLLERVGLQEAAHKKVGKYSRGMRQRLGLADVLVKNPEVIILDEPTLGIDPLGVRAFLDLIVTLSKEEQLTVLLSSHHLHQVQQVCDRVGIFVAGRLLAQGNIADLANALISDSEPFQIECAVVTVEGKTLNEQSLSDLRQRVLNLKGALSFSAANGKLVVGGSEDLTASIARLVIEAGYGLKSLSMREYGLDDIYTMYFEGGERYGKTA